MSCPGVGTLLLSSSVSNWPRSVIYVAVTVGLVGGLGVGSGTSPALVAGLCLTGTSALVAAGLVRVRPHQDRRWLAAWGLLGGGLLAVLGAAVVGALEGRLPTAGGLPTALDLVGAGLSAAGLVLLAHLRLPGRALEAVTEAVVLALGVAFVVLATAVVPRQGWHLGRQLAALAPPLLDLVVLWLFATVVALSDRRHPAYRFLGAGFVCLLAAHTLSAAASLAGRGAGTRTVAAVVETVVLGGAAAWAVAFVHRSRRRAFDPLPLRPTRPGPVRVALLVSTALVVPAALGIQSTLGPSARERPLVIASAFLPLVVLLSLLRQVFAHAAAEYRAQHDALTGVCNRLLFEDRLRRALVEARRNGTSVAVMFLDLDRFKQINDSLGHAVGNELLQAVVKRLQGSLREQDTLARFGGDEFTLLVPDAVGDDGSVLRFAERILDRFADPFSVGSRRLSVQASIGVAISPEDGDDADTLLKHADAAMYKAKSAGRNTFEVFDSAMSARARLRVALEDGLRAAVAGGALTVHYQPKLEVATGTIVGVEALARWQHPGLGFVPPAAFVALAEESSLVAALGHRVLAEACRQARRWQEAGVGVPVSVNVSARQFAHQSVSAMVRDVLGSTGLDPGLLELEMTESVLVEHVGEVAGTLSELRLLGVRCSIDDFGTGYSALAYLAEMPVDAVKIDGSFVARIDAERGCPIVGAVVALAHNLDLEVVAEGVETDTQLRFLEATGCDQVQGYRFSPAVPAPHMTALLHDPGRLFTDWRQEVAALPAPVGVVSPGALAALLESVLGRRHREAAPDDGTVEAVLGALCPGGAPRGAEGARSRPPRSA